MYEWLFSNEVRQHVMKLGLPLYTPPPMVGNVSQSWIPDFNCQWDSGYLYMEWVCLSYTLGVQTADVGVTKGVLN